jgi:DNA-binding transcriptional ArsR family regulator
VANYFDNIGNMEKNIALVGLTALAQETRLDIFRLLVSAGPDGRAAGDIGSSLALAPATLSFHLKELRRAGLIACRRNGRSLIYTADFATMSGLVAYLSENCCGGTCSPVSACPDLEDNPS